MIARRPRQGALNRVGPAIAYTYSPPVCVCVVYALLRAEMPEAPQPTALFRVRPRATEASRSLEVGTSLTRGGSDAFSLLLFITWRYGKRRSA